MKTTLIIHPLDESTTFLDTVYKDIPNKTVITGTVSKSDVVKLIIEHDRVMMMGHGSPLGLFSMNQFRTYAPYIIDYTIVPFLREKDDNVFIWCNSDKFVTFHNLKGFYTGMFISEVGEANYCGLKDVTQDIVDESNFGFCNMISNHIVKEKNELYESIREEYGLLAEHNPVALYNHIRLYKS
jgi:hypothetical protein